MSELQDVWDRGSRWRVIARAVLVLGGGVVAAVGVVAATASLVAGFGLGKSAALKVAVLFGGVALLAAFLGLFGRAAATDRSRGLAGVGTAVGVTGLALFWTTLPTGWTGYLAALPPAAVGTYVVGLLAVFGAGFTVEPADADRDSEDDRRDSDAFGSIESVVVSADGERGDTGRSSTVGGDDETEDDRGFSDGDERS